MPTVVEPLDVLDVDPTVLTSGRPVHDGAGQLVPVSLETVVTETGVLQLWCVARDGRRWKLEFNVREKVG